MKATYSLLNPELCEATLAVTLTIKEWEEIASQLSHNYPSWRFKEKIMELVIHANKIFRENGESK